MKTQHMGDLSGAPIGFKPEAGEPAWLLEMRHTRPVEVLRPEPPEDLLAYKRERFIPPAKRS